MFVPTAIIMDDNPDNTEDNPDNAECVAIKPFRKNMLYATTFIGSFFSATVMSLQEPFFPAEAEKKGITPAEYNLMFSVFSFANIAASALIGQVLVTRGIKNTLCFSLLLTAVTTILFGFLTFINSQSTWYGFSIFLRVAEAVGSQSFNISCIVALSFICSCNSSFKISIFEAIFGVGQLVGPLIGGLLYDKAGFVAPFVFVGLILVLCSVTAMTVIPKFPRSHTHQTSFMDTLNMVMCPGVGVNLYGTFASGISNSFLVACLEPHIKQFHLPIENIETIFMIMPLFYAVTTPIWGKLVSSWLKPQTVFALGAVTKIIAFTLIGPILSLGPQPSLWLVCIGLGIYGISSAMSYIGAMMVLINIAKDGSSDSEDACIALMASLWKMAQTTGYFLGPFICTVLSDAIGFHWETFIFALINVVYLILLGFQDMYLYGHLKQYKAEERQPLLKKMERTMKKHKFFI